MIKHMVSWTFPLDIHLNAILPELDCFVISLNYFTTIRFLCKKFKLVEWFHIIHEHNDLAGERANIAFQFLAEFYTSTLLGIPRPFLDLKVLSPLAPKFKLKKTQKGSYLGVMNKRPSTRHLHHCSKWSHTPGSQQPAYVWSSIVERFSTWNRWK